MKDISQITGQHANFPAKKSLGQNFLHAPHIVGKIIHETKIGTGSHILEVGPGKGVLTEGLLAAGAYVVGVEKDDRAVAFLREKFAEEIKTGTFKMVHGDILDFDPKDAGLACGEYIIAANIPYYITGEFLRKFLESACQPKRMVIMLQKEVAKRIVAEKNGKESILSISVKAYGRPSYITTVPARHFRPVPKVDSALLLIDTISKEFFKSHGANESGPYDEKNLEKSERNFFTIVKAGFAHKRKIALKNLQNLGNPGQFTQADDLATDTNRKILEKIWQERGLPPKIRAEDITLEDWKSIADAYAA